MTRRAVVLATDPGTPSRVIEFTEQDLLGQLYREIGTDDLDHSPTIRTPLGEMMLWCDGAGLLGAEIDHNDRAIAVCRAMGYMVPDLGGVCVFVGGADPMGETLGLSYGLLAEFDAAFGTGVGVVFVDPVEALDEVERAARRRGVR